MNGEWWRPAVIGHTGAVDIVVAWRLPIRCRTGQARPARVASGGWERAQLGPDPTQKHNRFQKYVDLLMSTSPWSLTIATRRKNTGR